MKKIILSLLLPLLIVMACPAKAQYGDSWVDDNFTDTHVGFSLGYVRGQIRSHFQNLSVFGNDFWEHREDKGLHGFSIGWLFQQHLGHSGFSFYEALNTELYYSSNDPVKTDVATSPNEAWSDYIEWTMNIPLHLQFAITMPFDDRFTVGFHTGPGYTLSFLGMYSDDRDLYSSNDVFEHDLKRSNFTYDLGAFLQYGYLRLELIWSRGLTCVQSYDGIDLYRNKFAASFVIMIP